MKRGWEGLRFLTDDRQHQMTCVRLNFKLLETQRELIKFIFLFIENC